jgi:hypothetical protein
MAGEDVGRLWWVGGLSARILLEFAQKDIKTSTMLKQAKT